MTHILAFHAHPDDIETLGAATLALLARKGHRLTIATMTGGDCGSTEYGLEETAAIRKKEAATAAALIGAAYDCANVPDLCVFNDDPTRRKTVELIRRHAPDVVITASPADYHPDHEATSMLVRDACFAVSVPNYATGPSPAMAHIPHLYFMDPIGGRDRDNAKVPAQFGVDVSDFLAMKLRMLDCHESQQAWVRKQHDIADQQNSVEKWTRHRGKTFGVAAAEGFRQYLGTPYPTTSLLQELVGAALLVKSA